MHFSPHQAYEKEDFVTQKTFKTAAFLVYLTKEYIFFFRCRQVYQRKRCVATVKWYGRVNLFPCELLSYRNLIQENVVKLIGHKDQEEFFLFIGWAVHLEAWGWVGTFRISALATNVLFIPSALSDLWKPWTRMLSVCLCPWGNIDHWLIHLFPFFTPIQNLPQ